MSIFLQIPNLIGDSNATNFKGQFEIGSLSWSGMNAVQANGSNLTTLTSVNVSKLATTNSPSLMLLMASQQNLGTIVMTLTKIGETALLPIDVYSLENAVLTGFSQAVGPNGLPIEYLVFIFSKITLTQFAYDVHDKKIAEDTHYWDVFFQMSG